MKLRLVREDGTPARIVDLHAFPSVDIDGVDCLVAEYEGPDPENDDRDTQEESGSICIRLDYRHLRRDDYVRRGPGRTDVVKKYECPFARRARQRKNGGPS